MTVLADIPVEGEHETVQAVKLSQALELMNRVKEMQVNLTETSKTLKKHMEDEAEDRKKFVKELHEIKLDIASLDKKVNILASVTKGDMMECKDEVRSNLHQETSGLMHSVKVEFKGDIKRLEDSIRTLADTINHHQDKGEVTHREIFERLRLVENTLATNSEWIALGKRVAYAIVGALAIGGLIAMGFTLK